MKPTKILMPIVVFAFLFAGFASAQAFITYNFLMTNRIIQVSGVMGQL